MNRKKKPQPNLGVVAGFDPVSCRYQAFLLDEAKRTKIVYLLGPRVLINARWLWFQVGGLISFTKETVLPFEEWLDNLTEGWGLEAGLDYSFIDFNNSDFKEVGLRLDIALMVYERRSKLTGAHLPHEIQQELLGLVTEAFRRTSDAAVMALDRMRKHPERLPGEICPNRLTGDDKGRPLSEEIMQTTILSAMPFKQAVKEVGV